jgi:uncharacterized cupin superfamily protein
MKTLNLRDIPDESWTSPKGAYAGCSKQVSVALGHDPKSGEASNRHPFEVELCRVPAGKKACPFHSHSAQWEYYHVLAGHGLMRHAEGAQPMGPGDVFVFPPGDPHQLTNTGEEDLVVYIVADNPLGESCHYPDSYKWLVRSPSRRIIRSEDIDYYDGEE